MTEKHLPSYRLNRLSPSQMDSPVIGKKSNPSQKNKIKPLEYNDETVFVMSGTVLLTSEELPLTSETLFLTSETMLLTSETMFLTSETVFLTSETVFLTS